MAEPRKAPYQGAIKPVGPQTLNGAGPGVETLHRRAAGPVRVGFIVNTFTFGGSETETIQMVYGGDPRLIRFTGIAVMLPRPLPEKSPPRDGSFPPIYLIRHPDIDAHDPRVRFVDSFKAAVATVLQDSDVVVTWGIARLHDYLPGGRLPEIVVHSKDSGDWARGFLQANSLMSRHYVANSTLAAGAFPEPVRGQVRIICTGINPNRVRPTLSRRTQRAHWELDDHDKVVGYIGRIEWDKGVSKTADGVARLPHQWKAVFVGLNPNARYIEQLTDHCEQVLPGRYRLLPWCDDVGSALAAFDVFCQPSEHEGFSNSLGEAWLAGVPTVYTENTGAIPDVGELGISVKPDADGDEMAAAVLRAYRNQAIVTRARQVIAEHHLAAHSVWAWTDYLIEVSRRASRLRVMLAVPAEHIAELPSWLDALSQHADEFDLCCVAIDGDYHMFYAQADTEVYQLYGAPTFHTRLPTGAPPLVQWTRPDAILVLAARWRAEQLGIDSDAHIVIAGPNPRSHQERWVRSLQDLCHEATHVLY